MRIIKWLIKIVGKINPIIKFFNKILFLDLFFWIFNIFIYINFECNNTNESIFIIIKSLLFLIVIFYFFIKFTEPLIEKKKNLPWEYSKWFKFSLIFILFFLSLLVLINIKSDYFRFLLILLNIISLILLYFYFSDHEVIELIFYSIRKKSKYFWVVVFICLSLNISMSIFLSYCGIELSSFWDKEQIKWWQIFLFSLINCLCSLIDPSNMSILIIITIMTIINSSLFFISALVFAESAKTVFSEEKGIIFIPTIKLESKKYQNIKFDKSLLNHPLNIYQFKKEFWDKFSNYKDQIEEEWVKDKYIFANSNEKIDDVLMNIKNKLGNELYEKYIEKINENIIRIKSKNLWNLLNADIKLINFNFNYYFEPLYDITIPNDKDIDQYINNLAKKYSINFDFELLNSDQSDENKKVIQFFSLKKNKISLLQDFDNKRLKRVYYVRFKLNCWKTFNWESIKLQLESFFLTDELKLKLEDFYFYNKYKKTLTLKVYDEFCIDNDKTEKILNAEYDYWFKDWFWKDKTKCETFLEYKMNWKEEKEQILIKVINSDCLFTKDFFASAWINKFDRKTKIKNKKKHKIESNSDDFIEINKNSTMHKIVIVTNNSDKLEQSLKERIFNFIGIDNIFNFYERIYLSKKYFSDFLKERHSLQLLVKNSFLANEENRKNFENLINEYQYSYDRYKFDNKPNNKFEYKIIPLNPLEDWDTSNEHETWISWW